MWQKFVDVHQHVLFGVDDGPDSEEKMYEMLKDAAWDGIGVLVATPHITPGVRKFPVEQYRKALDTAEEYIRTNRLKIRLYKGAEILYTEQTCQHLLEGRVPTMAGTDRVLVEFSPDVRYEKIHEAVESLNGNGFVPILAHVERYRELFTKQSRMESLKKEYQVYYQMNCATIAQRAPFHQRKYIQTALDEGMIDVLGTDAHNRSNRRTMMTEAWRVLRRGYGDRYANRLVSGWVLTA